MARQYWLIKSEPNVYGYEQLVADGKTAWEGVRNFEARNHLRAMKAKDLAFFYHSNVGKDIVGVARVVKEAYPDPSAQGEDWSAVDVEPVRKLHKPVSLADIKAAPELADIALLRRSRLSVVPVSEAHYRRILEMGETKAP